MRIGDLAKAAGCDIETVRHYERVGLLDPPPRDHSGYRQYSQDDLNRLQFIRYCRHLQIHSSEIAALIKLMRNPSEPCPDADALVDAQIYRVHEQMNNLRRLEELLLDLRQSCRERDAGRKNA